MWLAGDVGGTKITLGLYERAIPRPREIAVETIPTAEAESLPSALAAFIGRHRGTGAIDAATIGVAGPVLNGRAELTNVPWVIDAAEIARAVDIGHVALVNDLEALGHAIPVLHDDEVAVIQAGRPSARGSAVIIAAGTGLGEAVLIDYDGRLVPSPSEGGHADFAARNEREAALMAALTRWYGRASWEAVLSGPGLVNLHRFTHDGSRCPATEGVPDEDRPARITGAALAGGCSRCVEALELFVDAYGAEAGNMAVRAVATRGVFVGGGIAPKILPALRDGRFVAAFRSKTPMDDLVAGIPVKVILNRNAPLMGSAVHAMGMV
jgi:glucokinase